MPSGRRDAPPAHGKAEQLPWGAGLGRSPKSETTRSSPTALQPLGVEAWGESEGGRTSSPAGIIHPDQGTGTPKVPGPSWT